MDKIDQAIARIATALDRLENAVDQGEAGGGDVWGDATPDVPALQAANQDLEHQVRALRERAEEDAKLRAEAAEAVREALSDLRGTMAAQIDAADQGAPANA